MNATQATTLSPEQIRKAAAAAHEVLSGAEPQRILALTNELVLAKALLVALAAGQMVLASPAKKEEAKPAAAAKGGGEAPPADKEDEKRNGRAKGRAARR